MSKKDKKKSFTSQIYKRGIPVNVVTGYLIFTYSAIYVNMSSKQIPWGFLIATVLIIACEFGIAPISNMFGCYKVNKHIEKWERGEVTDVDEKMTLFKEVSKYPVIKAIETFAVFGFGSTLLCLGYTFVGGMNVDMKSAMFALSACIYGTYNAAIVGLGYAEKISCDYCERIVADGLDDEEIKKKQTYGISVPLRTVLYLILPSLFANIFSVVVIKQNYGSINGLWLTPRFLGFRFFMISCIDIAICSMQCVLFIRQIRRANNKLMKALTEFANNESQTELPPSNLSDSLQFNIYMMNESIRNFQSLVEKANNIGSNVRETTDNLNVIANELSSTALEQSASVKELLTTMNDTNALSQNIAGRINSVSGGTETTKQDVTQGIKVLKQNTQQMELIKNSNTTIIDGIKTLGEQIDEIGNVITIINDIADQTRIIAFNAELEAVSAGDAGKNFHIVATEIRRLANSTVNSVNEIHNYIQNIQNASKNLIQSSEEETLLISDEAQNTQELEKSFADIQSSAQSTSDKSAEIAKIIEQQTSSFNQIVITLRQISSSIENFTISTKTISETANQMREVAGKLADIKKVS